jgi:hypothetical protein
MPDIGGRPGAADTGTSRMFWPAKHLWQACVTPVRNRLSYFLMPPGGNACARGHDTGVARLRTGRFITSI